LNGYTTLRTIIIIIIMCTVRNKNVGSSTFPASMVIRHYSCIVKMEKRHFLSKIAD
jgi:hypothetical protein